MVFDWVLSEESDAIVTVSKHVTKGSAIGNLSVRRLGNIGVYHPRQGRGKDTTMSLFEVCD